MMESNEATEKENLLSYMAARAAEERFFLASAISAYQRANQLDRLALANWLDLTEGQLIRLELCRRPDADEPNRAKGVANICGKFGIEPNKLEAILAGK